MRKPLAACSILVRRLREAGAFVTRIGLESGNNYCRWNPYYRVKGMLCLMRYSSVECTVVVPRRARRRFGFLPWSKCRLPARERSTLPLAVILNRLAAAFLVL